MPSRQDRPRWPRDPAGSQKGGFLEAPASALSSLWPDEMRACGASYTKFGANRLPVPPPAIGQPAPTISPFAATTSSTRSCMASRPG